MVWPSPTPASRWSGGVCWRLKDGVALDHEAADSVEVTVNRDRRRRAVDQRDLRHHRHRRERDADRDFALSAATVAENAAGAVIGTLTVTDPDAGDSHGLASPTPARGGRRRAAPQGWRGARPRGGGQRRGHGHRDRRRRVVDQRDLRHRRHRCERDATGTVSLGFDATLGLLFASSALTDAEGLGTITYRWQVNDGGTWSDIIGATAPTLSRGSAGWSGSRGSQLCRWRRHAGGGCIHQSRADWVQSGRRACGDTEYAVHLRPWRR